MRRLLLALILLVVLATAGTAAASAVSSTNLVGSTHVDGTLTTFNADTGNMTSQKSVGTYLAGIAGTPAGTKLYVCDQEGARLYVMSTTGEVLKTITGVQGPNTAVSDPTGRYVYVSDIYSDSVYVIDTTTDTIAYTIPTDTTPQDMAMLRDGSKLYVGCGDYVDVINATSKTVTNRLSIAGYAVIPFGISVSEPQAGTGIAAAQCINISNPTGLCKMFFWYTSDDSAYGSHEVLCNAQDFTYTPDGLSMYSLEQGNLLVKRDWSGNWQANITIPGVVIGANNSTSLFIVNDNRLFVSWGKNISVYHTQSGQWLGNMSDTANITRIQLYTETNEITELTGHLVTFALKVNGYDPVPGITITVYKSDGTVFDTKVTDAAGVATFQLAADKSYTVRMTSAGGMNKTITLTPSGDYYGIVISAADLGNSQWNPGGAWNTTGNGTAQYGTGNMMQDINCSITAREDIPNSIGYIDVSYADASRSTSNVTFILYMRSPTDSRNETPVQSVTSTTFINGTSQWQTQQVTQNVIQNSGFETGEYGWNGWGGGGSIWTEVTTGDHYSGSACARMNWINSTTSWQQTLMSNATPVISGGTVTPSIWLRTTDAPTTTSLIVWWLYPNGTIAGAAGPLSCNPTSTWTQYSATYTAPAYATQFTVSISAAGTGDDNLYIDDAQASTLAGINGNNWYTFIVSNCRGKDVMVKCYADPGRYNSSYVKTTPFTFRGRMVSIAGLPDTWYFWGCLAFLTLLTGVSLATKQAEGGGITCFFAFIFCACGWFQPLGEIGTFSVVGLAFLVCCGKYINDRERKG